ncbi:MAG: HD domain-containing protein [Gammaproteobacteria bacterium]
MSDLVARAREFATQAHRRIDQRRKYSHQPYESHLKSVAKIVAETTDDEEMVAAAWLHDTLEDTPATYEDVEEAFGPSVASLVAELTDVSRPSDGNRTVRKAIDRAHLARASARAKTVKLADIMDNTRDIVDNDPAFGRVFVTEAALLLEVLEGGDPRLLAETRNLVHQSARRLGLPELPPGALAVEEALETALPEKPLLPPRVVNLLADAFRASDIAEPLRSFDASRNPRDLARHMEALDMPVAGIRIDGTVMGYVTREDLADPEGGQLRSFAEDQVVDGEASLSDVIFVMNRHDYCFVQLLGEISGVITRADVQKPLVRMWLFGMITMLEMEITARIRARWPGESWTHLVSKGRLDKARELREERIKRGQPCELLDCLQYADKAQIMAEDPATLAAFGFKTKGSARRTAADMESLRNHLAHAQDIVTHDWAQIVRMTQRLEEIARRDY